MNDGTNEAIIDLIRTMADDIRRERDRDALDSKIKYALDKLEAFEQYNILIKNGVDRCRQELEKYHKTRRSAREERLVKDLISLAGRYLDNPMHEVRQPPNPKIPYDHVNVIPDLWKSPPPLEAIREAKRECKEWQRKLLDQIRKYGDRKLRERVDKPSIQRNGDFFSPCFNYYMKWNCQIANKRKCKQNHGCLPCFYILKEDQRDHEYGPACEVYHIKKRMDQLQKDDREHIAKNIDKKSKEAKARREKERPHEKDLRYKLENPETNQGKPKGSKNKPTKDFDPTKITNTSLLQKLIETQSLIIKLQGKRSAESSSSSISTEATESDSNQSDKYEGNFKRQKKKKKDKKHKKSKRKKPRIESSSEESGKDDAHEAERPTSPNTEDRTLRRPNPIEPMIQQEPVPSTSHSEPQPIQPVDAEAEIAKLLKSDDEEMNVISIEGGTSPQNLPPAKDVIMGTCPRQTRKDSDIEAISLHVTSPDICKD